MVSEMSLLEPPDELDECEFCHELVSECECRTADDLHDYLAEL